MKVGNIQVKSSSFALATAVAMTFATPARSATEAETPNKGQRQMLEDKLIGLGVEETEAQTRVKNMTEAEVGEAVKKVEKLPAGKGDSITIGVGTAILIAILLIIFL